MPPTTEVAENLALELKGKLALPKHEWHWRDLGRLKVPGLEFIGNWCQEKLSPGDIVVVVDHSKTTANPALIVGTVGADVRRYNCCVPINIRAVLTPKEESAESCGYDPGKSLLFGGFQVFRYKGHNKIQLRGGLTAYFKRKGKTARSD